MRWILLIALTATGGGCVCYDLFLRPAPPPVYPQDPLPPIFAPLQWTTPERELRTLLPGLQEAGAFGEPFHGAQLLYSTDNASAPWGESALLVEYFLPHNGVSQLVRVLFRMDDPRPQCVDGPTPPSGCLGPGPAKLRRAFNDAS